MGVRIRLPGGTLKIKRYVELRGVERRREVPVLVIGFLYIVWWSWLSERRFGNNAERRSAAASRLASDVGD